MNIPNETAEAVRETLARPRRTALMPHPIMLERWRGNQVIPDEAVVAAAKVLYADKMSNHGGDNAPQIIDACEKVARKMMEAAAPHLMAAAWDAGYTQ